MKKLKEIEDVSFEMGNLASKAFTKDGNGMSLRFAIMSYRCSMQSIRDQARYKVSLKTKN